MIKQFNGNGIIDQKMLRCFCVGNWQRNKDAKKKTPGPYVCNFIFCKISVCPLGSPRLLPPSLTVGQNCL